MQVLSIYILFLNLQVNLVAQQNLLDSFLFEELLNLWAQQGRLWTETEEQNRILDGRTFGIESYQF